METVKLTAEQKKLVRGVPGLAERTAAEATKRYGQIRPAAELIISAHYGIALAAQSWEPSVGMKFEEWAKYKAMWTILDDARVERRQVGKLHAAQIAGQEFQRFSHCAPSEADADRTEAEDRARLDKYKAGYLAAILRGVAAMPVSMGGEDDMVALLDASRAAAALKQVYDCLRPEQIELLSCESEADLKALAPKWGKSWWTLGRGRAKLLELVGARLAGQRVDAMPAWDDEVWRGCLNVSGVPEEGP